jgi:hypothetical protein
MNRLLKALATLRAWQLVRHVPADANGVLIFSYPTGNIHMTDAMARALRKSVPANVQLIHMDMRASLVALSDAELERVGLYRSNSTVMT